MKKQKKTIKELIDEIMREFDKEFGEQTEVWSPSGSIGRRIKDFLRQSLFKIAKATAEAGKIELKEKDEINSSFSNRALKFSDGWNEARKRITEKYQQQLKQFLGDYDQKPKNN